MTSRERDDIPARLASVGILIATAAAFVLRWSVHQGFGNPDAWRYAKFLKHYLTGTPFTELDHAAPRLSFLLPTGMVAEVLGGALEDLAVANLLLSLVNIPLLYILTHQMTRSHLTALLAASLSALAVRDAVALTFLPDALLLTYVLMFFIAFIAADRQPYWGVRQALGLALAGACIGWAYSTKEPGILLAPFIGVAVLRRDWRHPTKVVRYGVCLVVGLVVTVAIEWSVLAWYTGSFWYKPDSLAVHNAMMDPGSLGGALDALWLQLEFVLHPNHGMGLFGILGGIAAIAFAYRRVRSPEKKLFEGYAGLVAAWGVFAAAYLAIGTSSLTRYLPPTLHIRYANVFIFPIYIALAVAIASLWNRPRFFWGVLTLVLVVHVPTSYKAWKLTTPVAPYAALCVAKELDPHDKVGTYSKSLAFRHQAENPDAPKDVIMPVPSAESSPPRYFLVTSTDRWRRPQIFDHEGPLRFGSSVYRRVHVLDDGRDVAAVFQASCANRFRDRALSWLGSSDARKHQDSFWVYRRQDAEASR